jgi:hypothetical protein
LYINGLSEALKTQLNSPLILSARAHGLTPHRIENQDQTFRISTGPRHLSRPLATYDA